MTRNETRRSVAESPFATRLKLAQEQAELTNEQAARAIGVGLRTYQNWRAGMEPRTQYRFAVARFYGKPLSWFFEDDGEREAVA